MRYWTLETLTTAETLTASFSFEFCLRSWLKALCFSPCCWIVWINGTSSIPYCWFTYWRKDWQKPAFFSLAARRSLRHDFGSQSTSWSRIIPCFQRYSALISKWCLCSGQYVSCKIKDPIASPWNLDAIDLPRLICSKSVSDEWLGKFELYLLRRYEEWIELVAELAATELFSWCRTLCSKMRKKYRAFFRIDGTF